MLEESIIDLILVCHSVVLVIIYGIMYKNRRISSLWMIISIMFLFASVFFYFRFIGSIYRIIGNVFYTFAGITLSFSIFKEYKEIFSSKNKKNEKRILNPLKNSFFPISFSFIIINSIQIFLYILLLITTILMVRILLKRRSITHFFMLLAQITGFLTLFFSLLHNFDINGTWELAYYMKIILYGALLVVGLTAPTENKLNRSERKFKISYNRAEFYKDIFAHDISNILQNIQSAMELLSLYSEDPPDEEEIPQLLNMVKSQIIRGGDLVSNIRKLSEIEEMKESLSLIEVNNVLQHSIKELKRHYDDKQINIQVYGENQKYKVVANEWLIDVFENIIFNAVEHNNNDKIELLIKVSKVRIDRIDYIKLEFIDNGIGIPDQIKKKVFQREVMKGKNISGRGLGLSLVRKIIERYKGRIWVEDRIKGDYSKGSNFILLIPTAEKSSGR
jgi:signal transduction histidine kinase